MLVLSATAFAALTFSLADDAGEDAGHRDDGDLRGILVRARAQRNRVGDEDFLQGGTGDVLEGFAREDAVGRAGADARGALLHQDVGGLAEGAGGVDHVVHDDDVAAFDLADRRDRGDDVRLLAGLVADHDGAAEVFRVGVRALGAAHVGRGDREVLDVHLPDVR